MPYHANHDFYNTDHELFASSESPSNISATLDPGPDEYLQSLIMRPKHLKVMHLNTQSMVSAFGELLLTIKQYPFNVISMSETWPKDNPLLLNHVTIPGYNCEFRSRNSIRGGGVGAYIKETLTYKRRSDIEAKELDLEHLWLEFPGRNKNSKLLLGTMYRSERMLNSTKWLERFKNLLGHLTATWDGPIVVKGDINIDLLRPNKPITSQYQFILSSLNLHQHVHKPTRTTDKTSTLIDHIISNLPERNPHTDVLPCPLVSDQDAVYATINIKVTRFQIRHKFIRNLKNFDESSFIEDFKTLPFAASFGVSDPDEKLEILSSLRKECIDRHALSELTKVTRPPAPWLKDPAIAELKEQRDRLRSAARTSNNNKETWEKFHAAPA